MKPCKIWEGGKTKAGYGVCYVPVRKREYIHRLEWIKNFGPILNGLCVLHKCDTPPCYEITHLFLGTRAENSADMKAKGRSTIGERNPNSKLNQEAVTLIRERIENGESQISIAKLFGVTASNISQIARKVSWR